MKHIKPFNLIKEDKDIFIEELKKFCNDNLAYLIDDGMNVSVMSWDTIDIKQYRILLFTKVHIKTKWDKMKDDIIPFLTILNDKYKLITLSVVYSEVKESGIYEVSKSFNKDNLEELEDFNTEYLKRIAIFIE